jgi:hypothetical protein
LSSALYLLLKWERNTAKMPQVKKNGSSRFSILAICFIALVIFAGLSLYAMITRQVTPQDATPQKGMFYMPATGGAIAEVDVLAPVPPMSVSPPEVVLPVPKAVPVASHLPEGEMDAADAVVERDISKVLSPSRYNTSGLPTLHAVTYASHGGKDDRFCRAIESAVRHEVDLIILGWGKKALKCHGRGIKSFN